jgi:hypothetical protein
MVAPNPDRRKLLTVPRAAIGARRDCIRLRRERDVRLLARRCPNCAVPRNVGQCQNLTRPTHKSDVHGLLLGNLIPLGLQFLRPLHRLRSNMQRRSRFFAEIPPWHHLSVDSFSATCR